MGVARSTEMTICVGLFGLFVAALGASACGSDDGAGFDDAQSASGAGGSTTTAATSSTAATSGSGGQNPLSEDCTALCEHVDNINCTAFGDCRTVCPDALGAPDECVDEFEVLLGCWVDNLQKFACTPIQVLSPYECHAEEVALQDCIESGTVTAPPGCSGQVCNSSDTTCSCKTFCESDELKSACTPVDNTWTCSCFQNENLLGTCTQALDYCDNYQGCCASYFGT